MSSKAELLKKANGLPLCPGVYIMRDRASKVIYVGKSAKLKNRVSQYFQNSEKDLKTSKMVSSVFEFDYILCDTEIEALSLENALIKQYNPRYNIRLKDSKSYPYIKITNEEYPRILFTRTRLSDKARYFGPYTGASTVFGIMSLLNKTLGIPSCKLHFPKDIGKGRECLYYQMKQCCGVCMGHVTAKEYNELIGLRKEVRNAIKRADRSGDTQNANELREHNKDITSHLTTLRKHIKICDRVISRDTLVKDLMDELHDHAIWQERNLGPSTETQTLTDYEQSR